MDAKLFTQMLSDKRVTDLKKLGYKYPQADISEFVGLLQNGFYKPLELRDFSGNGLVFLESAARVRAAAVKALLTPQQSTQSYGLKAVEEEIASTLTIYNDQDSPKQTVFYFHGGAYVNQPNNQQFTMSARTAKETGAEVVLMVYPKAPVFTCSESYEACKDYYLSYIENHDCGKIVFMGDSAGGGMALGMAELLKKEGETGPEELILISPWIDLSMENPDMEQYLDKDPMLGIPGCKHIAEVWAGELDIRDPLVSPLFGDFSGLCDVTLFTGTWEILYPDSILLSEKLEEAEVTCRLTVGENMIHCYPIIPAPEAKEAQSIIWETVLR